MPVEKNSDDHERPLTDSSNKDETVSSSEETKYAEPDPYQLIDHEKESVFRLDAVHDENSVKIETSSFLPSGGPAAMFDVSYYDSK